MKNIDFSTLSVPLPWPKVCFVLLFAAFCSATGFSQSQSIDPSQGLVVNYLLTVGPVEAPKSAFITPLHVKDGRSVYVIDSDKAAGVKHTTDAAGQIKTNITLDDEEGRLYYTDQNTQQLISRELVVDQPVLVKESIPDFTWNITQKSREIAGYQCFEATTEFRGRNYSVWFTPSLPLNAGPWKFSGLPGLVLEVNDHVGKFNWFCQSIKPLDQVQAEAISPPTGKKMLDFPTYFDLNLEKFNAFFERMASHPGITVSKPGTEGFMERTK